MLKTRRRSERPLTELSDTALGQRIADARKVIERLPDSPPHAEIDKHLAVAEAAARDRQAASAELARRQQAEKDAKVEPVRRALEQAQRNAHKSVPLRALELVARFRHHELADETLVASRLDEEEGRELVKLASRLLEGETLDDTETARYEKLVGKAAGDEGLCARKRAERAEADKLDALRAAERRHPQADDLVAAVMSDPLLADGLKRRLRPAATATDELGVERQGVTAAVIFDFNNIAALHVLVSLIVQNGGNDIHVGEHGALGDGLPNLPTGSLGQLRRNGYLTIAQAGTGMRVGVGPRTREIAAKWKIELPTADGDG